MEFLKELVKISYDRENPLEVKIKKTLDQVGLPLLEEKAVGEFSEGNDKIFTIYDDLENPFVHKIAKAIGVPDGGNLKKIGQDFYATYNHGSKLTFYADPSDFDEDE